MNKKVLAALTAGLITFAPFTATNAAPAQDRESIYQVALLQSLTMGYFDGTITVKELKSHGDIGIGTFDNIIKVDFGKWKLVIKASTTWYL